MASRISRPGSRPSGELWIFASSSSERFGITEEQYSKEPLRNLTIASFPAGEGKEGGAESFSPVLVSFFGGLGLGQVAAREQVRDMPLRVASLLDIAGTKAAVVQKRAEIRDYLDIDALLGHGIDLPTVLAAGAVIYGRKFNPLITLKALSYFDDIPMLPGEVRARLARAVEAVDVSQLPVLTPYVKRPENGITP